MEENKREKNVTTVIAQSVKYTFLKKGFLGGLPAKMEA